MAILCLYGDYNGIILNERRCMESSPTCMESICVESLHEEHSIKIQLNFDI